LHRFAYFFREAMKNIRHSPLLTTVSVCTLAVSLIMLGFFGHLLFNAQQLLNDIGKDLKITVYLSAETSVEDAEIIKKAVSERDDVESVFLLTPKEDRARNRALLDPELIAGLDSESIPGSPCLDIVLKRKSRVREDFDSLATWLGDLESVAQVEDIHYTAQKFRVIYAMIDIIELVGFILCGVILFASIFFVFSTIKLAVYARHEEIEVLRLVGATDGFIRAPFYIEGLLQGLTGALVALVTVAVLHFRIQRFIQVEQGLNFELDLLPMTMVLWFIFGGMLLGLAGSAFSVGKHLKV
jgi:cell division transport system permease protein